MILLSLIPFAFVALFVGFIAVAIAAAMRQQRKARENLERGVRRNRERRRLRS